jgi:hypothetical protein
MFTRELLSSTSIKIDIKYGNWQSLTYLLRSGNIFIENIAIATQLIYFSAKNEIMPHVNEAGVCVRI